MQKQIKAKKKLSKVFFLIKALKEYDIDEETVRKDVKEYIAKLKELKIVHD